MGVFVCVVMRIVVGVRIWVECLFRHAGVMYVSVLIVCILNAAFCMTNCSLLMLVEDAKGDHMEVFFSLCRHRKSRFVCLSDLD